MARYAMIWYDRRQKKPRTKRKFTFDFKIVPEKYRNRLEDAMKWAQGYLANKYGIPKSKVDVEQAWQMKKV